MGYVKLDITQEELEKVMKRNRELELEIAKKNLKIEALRKELLHARNREQIYKMLGDRK